MPKARREIRRIFVGRRSTGLGKKNRAPLSAISSNPQPDRARQGWRAEEGDDTLRSNEEMMNVPNLDELSMPEDLGIFLTSTLPRYSSSLTTL